jgi:hypothetical protein
MQFGPFRLPKLSPKILAAGTTNCSLWVIFGASVVHGFGTGPNFDTLDDQIQYYQAKAINILTAELSKRFKR